MARNRTKAQIEDLYHEVYPGIIARARKFAKGNKQLSEDWASEATLTMIEVFKRYKDSMDKNQLVLWIGKSVANRLSNCYYSEKRKSGVMTTLTGEVESKHGFFDYNISQKETDLQLSEISKEIQDERLREFLNESYDPSSDTIEIVEKRISIRKNDRDSGQLRFNLDRDHPTDKEIGQKIGISKATSSRFRSELKKLAKENEWL